MLIQPPTFEEVKKALAEHTKVIFGIVCICLTIGFFVGNVLVSSGLENTKSSLLFVKLQLDTCNSDLNDKKEELLSVNKIKRTNNEEELEAQYNHVNEKSCLQKEEGILVNEYSTKPIEPNGQKAGVIGTKTGNSTTSIDKSIQEQRTKSRNKKYCVAVLLSKNRSLNIAKIYNSARRNNTFRNVHEIT